MAEAAVGTHPTILDTQCFTIFEGGGAKGITHLGALKALEDVGLARIGTAGTSAGAIIAALNAVGYRADELFRTGSDNILANRHLTPIDLLGRDDWSLFSKFRGSQGGSALGARVGVLKRKLVLAIFAILSPVAPLWVFCLARTTGRPALFASLWRIIDTFGFFSTHSARDILNTLLCEKLGLEPGTLVCFRHVEPGHAGCCRLKIITTNLHRRGLELFDETTPNVVVADAVAASFSIPIFFKPTLIRTVDHTTRQVGELADSYVDGGLISNLPVWVFAEDKKAIERLPENSERRPLPIIAFQLKDKPRAVPVGRNPLLGLLDFVGNVIRTGIFGGQSIAENFVTHLTIVELPTDLGVVQFDCTSDEARRAYESGRTASDKELQAVFRDNPSQRRRILADVVGGAERISRATRTDGIVATFRACVVRRLGNRSFKVIASVNMDADADDDFVLDQRNPGAPTAFHDRDVTYVDTKAPNANLRMTKYERAQLRPTLAAVISVPIFDTKDEWSVAPPSNRKEPLGVLCLDSDVPLQGEYHSIPFIQMLASCAVDLAPHMRFEKETS